jgi:hypothetical protein
LALGARLLAVGAVAGMLGTEAEPGGLGSAWRFSSVCLVISRCVRLWRGVSGRTPSRRCRYMPPCLQVKGQGETMILVLQPTENVWHATHSKAWRTYRSDCGCWNEDRQKHRDRCRQCQHDCCSHRHGKKCCEESHQWLFPSKPQHVLSSHSM